MHRKREIWFSLAVAVWLTPPAQAGGRACKLFTAPERGRIALYAQKKYKLPTTARVKVTNVTAVAGTCNRKITIEAPEEKRPFKVDLYLSSDLRFLSREMLDTTVDPIAEERKEQEQLERGLSAGDHPVAGTRSAAITVSVFSDFQCPYCAKMAQILKNDVLSPETGNVRVVFRHLPLSIHPWARAAAEATACAYQQSDAAFWSMHDFIFEHQTEITPQDLRPRLEQHARTMKGFDRNRFSQCIATRATRAAVDGELAFAAKYNISGTPTVFVNGRRLQGGNPEQIRTFIREATPIKTAQGAARR